MTCKLRRIPGLSILIILIALAFSPVLAQVPLYSYAAKWSVDKPTGVAVNESGYIYVTSASGISGTHRIYVLSPGLTQINSWSGLSDPRHVRVNRTGAVYIAEGDAKRINCLLYTSDAADE